MQISFNYYLYRKAGLRRTDADADFGSTKVVDIVYFYLCIDASAFFEEAAAFIGRNRIAAAAEAYKLNQMHIRILGNIFGLPHTGGRDRSTG